MKSSRLYTSFLFFLLTFLSASLPIQAFDDEADDYDLKDRVVRISLIAGEVNLKRKGNTDWERARLNFPLVEGDTLSTDRDSRLEVQIDARNFLRLAALTTVQIVALRDEGVALSVIEGTAVFRLAKFDRQREYFEVDAPRTTMAAEKKGLYRIDVPKNGRVRFSVRDGGSARIYSDTSGFALRDGRTAELVIAGDNTGDWEFVANSAFDLVDDWVNDRERYLAQRLRYNTQYYDEYVWGAEDLDSYGDWAYTTDYGWIWRPHSSSIGIYSDWAPYRYGRWVWCPPYGWTWVGYEPWGWAPYHYGRWVYHGGYWAWCPRSAYYRQRSWWSPALVAIYIFDNDYCWYPLNYHQRDPRSRYYNHPGRLTALRSDELAGLRRVNPVQLRAVTSVRANQVGSDNVRPARANDALARQVLSPAAAPMRTGLPARQAATAATATTEERPLRVRSSAPDTPASTGAAVRTPGVPMDSELRRSRVFNGRDARPATSDAGPVVNSDVETRPTGAVTRPTRMPRETVNSGNEGPRPTAGADDRPERRSVTAPSNTGGDTTQPARVESTDSSESGERPMRTRERVEPARPERRSEAPTPTIDPPTRSEPPRRVETPQRNEAPPQRTEAPPQRSEPPQRTEAPPQRSEPPSRSEPPQRSESPRSESPRSEAPRSEPTRSEPSRSEPRSEPPARPSRPDNYEPPERSSRSESPRSEPSRSEAPRSEPQRSEPTRSEPSRSESPRSEPTRSEPTRSEPVRSEPSRSESPRSSESPARPAKPDNNQF